MTAKCLQRFGLEKKVQNRIVESNPLTPSPLCQFHVIAMDNASNCDVTADELANLIPGFHGRASRTRCVPHTVNLIAKVS